MNAHPSTNRPGAGRRTAVVVATLLATVSLTLASAGSVSAAAPTSQSIDFSASGYTVGDQSPVGQNGWSTDTRTTPDYDYGLVDNSSFPSSGLGSSGVSLRFSNATSPTTIGQLMSPSIAAAGETSSGASDNTFTASYTVASATGGYQPGLALEVSIGHASDRSGGDLIFRHVDGNLEIGSIWMPSDGTSDDVPQWRSTRIAGPLAGGLWDASVPHTITTVVHFLDNATDLVEVTIDGQQAGLVPDWEYYSKLTSSTPKTATNLDFRTTSSAPSLDGIGYQTGLPAAPATDGEGFLFGDISYGSSLVTGWTPPEPTTAPIPVASDTALPPAAELPSSALAGTDSRSKTLDLGPDFANQYVAIYAYSSPKFLGWFLADGSGVVSFSIPSSVPDGTHSIAAYDTTGAVVGWIGGISVVTAADPGSGGSGDTLATTGVEALPPLLGGVLALLLGFAIVLRGRRRRAR